MFRFGSAILVVFPALALAQIHPHFGVEIGTPLTDTLRSDAVSAIPNVLLVGAPASPTTSVIQYNGHTRRLLIGPTFRVEWVHGLGIEFDALYQRLSYDEYSAVSPPLSYTFDRASANRWQFPLLMQYSRKISKTRTFVEAGPSILHVTGSQGNSTSVMTFAANVTPPILTTTTKLAGSGSTSAGATMGGGIDLPFGLIHFRPEFRYSRWFAPVAGGWTGGIASPVSFFPLSGFLTSSPILVPPSFHANQNEASFLLGITF